MKELFQIIQADKDFIMVLSIAVLLDIVTGVIKAIINHDLKSCKFKEGMLKKILDYVLVVIALCLDYILKVDYISVTCLYAMIAMEFYSCIENLRVYIPIPEVLEKALNVLDNKAETVDYVSRETNSEETEETKEEARG